MFLIVLCNFVTYWLVEYCNLAPFEMNSTFIPTCMDYGSVNEYVHVCVCMYVCMYVCVCMCVYVCVCMYVCKYV